VLALPLAAPAQQTLEGHTFAAGALVGGQPLQLNGVGLRAVAWLKGYAAGLYLPARATTAAQATALPGAKRIDLRMLQDVPAAEFVKAIDKGIARNTPESRHAALAERRAAFDRAVTAVGTVRKGDVVHLDYVPGTGLVFLLNGRLRGEPIPGEDFYAAVMLIFLGERPVDARLKAGLLGGSS
jgi:hypothetical protein